MPAGTPTGVVSSEDKTTQPVFTSYSCTVPLYTVEIRSSVKMWVYLRTKST
jgi:hypothetical protein